MYDRILIPVDGSERSIRAIDRAIDLAETYDAAVHVLYVIDATDIPAVVDREWVLEALEEEGREALAAVHRRANRAGLETVERSVTDGQPHRAILEYAADRDVDLIVMSTHGRTGLDRYLLGSVTERVVRLSEIPVLTVRTTDDDDRDSGYESVLIPTDGSAGAKAAIEHGVDIARRYGATVHALYVVDVRTVMSEYDEGVPPIDLLDVLEERGERAVAVVARTAEAADVPVRTHVSRGVPYHDIRDYVDEHDVDLVAMGTHGRTGIDRLLLGSVTKKVVRWVECPVLTVRLANATS